MNINFAFTKCMFFDYDVSAAANKDKMKLLCTKSAQNQPFLKLVKIK